MASVFFIAILFDLLAKYPCYLKLKPYGGLTMLVGAIRLYTQFKYSLRHLPPKEITSLDKKTDEYVPTLTPSEWYPFRADIDGTLVGNRTGTLHQFEVPLYNPYCFLQTNKKGKKHHSCIRRFGQFFPYWEQVMTWLVEEDEDFTSWDDFMSRPHETKWYLGPIRGKRDSSVQHGLNRKTGQEWHLWALVVRTWDYQDKTCKRGYPYQTDTSMSMMIFDRTDVMGLHKLHLEQGKKKPYWTWMNNSYSSRDGFTTRSQVEAMLARKDENCIPEPIMAK